MAEFYDSEASEMEEELEYYDSDVNTTDEEDEGEDLDAQAAEGRAVGLDVPPAQIAVRGRGPYQFEPLAQVQVKWCCACDTFSSVHSFSLIKSWYVFVTDQNVLLHLKSIHPLWKILEKCATGGSINLQMHLPLYDFQIGFITEGVNILFRSAKWAYLLWIHTPPVNDVS